MLTVNKLLLLELSNFEFKVITIIINYINFCNDFGGGTEGGHVIIITVNYGPSTIHLTDRSAFYSNVRAILFSIKAADLSKKSRRRIGKLFLFYYYKRNKPVTWFCLHDSISPFPTLSLSSDLESGLQFMLY